MSKRKKGEGTDFWAKVGGSLVAGGAFVKDHARDLYESIDPDVRRHLLQMPLLSYSLLGSRDDPVEPGEPDGHPPLVFVHGLGGSRGDFMLMSWYLWFHGRKRSYRIHFERRQDIPEMARALASFVRKVKKATREPRVDIVAHSLGGVVTRVALARNRLGTSVATVVTMGSPHHGTWSARYASTVKTRELRPDSEFIREINEKPWPKKVKVFNFFSSNDLLITPHESAVTDGAVHVDMSPATHYDYLLERTCWTRVRKALEDGLKPNPDRG
ncbi:MAG: alpha/beta fold hydrolase [Deltaproteobacteria bacterium]|nr:alpha/beta fold hydrolase [Deltaproteobacteria bacterium]